MRVPIDWLKEYVDFQLSPAGLADKLAMSGTEVEAVEPVGEDTVLELEVTPNRPDCLGMIGVAREVVAILRAEGKGNGRSELKRPTWELTEEAQKTAEIVRVEIKDPELCPRYAARVITGLKVKESPVWMKKRLEAAGIRALNNLVDVTNYVMLETAQPLHAFDLDRIKEGQIIVRRASAGEEFVTLDGVSRQLTPDMLVIADSAEPVALAGVMGGLYSEVSAQTTTVLLESANFNPKNIMRTSRTLGLMSESSNRFEKGIDPNGVIYALDRAAYLLQEIAGGKVLKEPVDVYPQELSPKTLTLRPTRVNSLLGTDLSPKEIAGILKSLGLTISSDTTMTVSVPTFRLDLEREIDLVEEIARIFGYHKIPSRLTRGGKGGLSAHQRLEKRLKEILVRAGLREIITYSFIGPKEFEFLGLPVDFPLRDSVRLRNPLTEDQALMRTMLLPGVLEILKLNHQRGNYNSQVFEMGRVFRPTNERLPRELPVVAAALTGRWRGDEWYGKSEAIDFFDAKGVLENIFARLGIGEWTLERLKHPAFHPGRCGELMVDGESLGILGEIHPGVQKNYGLENPVAYFEIAQEKLFSKTDLVRAFREIPRFPAVSLDIAIVVDEAIAAEKVAQVIQEVGGALLERAHLFDFYRGKPIPDGKKSLAYSLVFRDPHRTLSEEEVKKVYEQMVINLQKRLDAQIRI